MTDYQKKIDAIVEEALTEKTFSLEVVQKIKALKDDLADLQEANNKWREDFNDQKITLGKETSERLRLEERVEKLQQDIEGWESREDNLIKREISQSLLDLRANMNEQFYHELKDLVGIIFKNPVTIKQVNKQEATPNTTLPQYPGQMLPPVNISTLTDTERISTE
jgi:chromosome segregation ATPase